MRVSIHIKFLDTPRGMHGWLYKNLADVIRTTVLRITQVVIRRYNPSGCPVISENTEMRYIKDHPVYNHTDRLSYFEGERGHFEIDMLLKPTSAPEKVCGRTKWPKRQAGSGMNTSQGSEW